MSEHFRCPNHSSSFTNGCDRLNGLQFRKLGSHPVQLARSIRQRPTYDIRLALFMQAAMPQLASEIKLYSQRNAEATVTKVTCYHKTKKSLHITYSKRRVTSPTDDSPSQTHLESPKPEKIRLLPTTQARHASDHVAQDDDVPFLRRYKQIGLSSWITCRKLTTDNEATHIVQLRIGPNTSAKIAHASIYNSSRDTSCTQHAMARNIKQATDEKDEETCQKFQNPEHHERRNALRARIALETCASLHCASCDRCTHGHERIKVHFTTIMTLPVNESPPSL